MKNPKQLERMIQHIRNSYGKTMVSGEIVDFLASQLKHIPSEAIGWIQQEFIRRHQKCPEVLHIAILSLYHSWRSEHPEKCTSEEPGRTNGCANPNCHGGIMIFWHPEKFYGGTLHSFAVACGDCRRMAGSKGFSMVRMSDALKRGWEPDSTDIQRRCIHEARELADERTAYFAALGKEKLLERGANNADRAGVRG